MKIAVLGTGVVGNVIGSKLIQLGHQVMMGSRTSNNEKATAWVQQNGSNASQATFAEAAKFGEIVFNCTNGGGSIAALESSGVENFGSKVLPDITKPADVYKGMAPTLLIANNDS